VLTREPHLAATGLTPDETRIFLDGLAALMLPVETHFLWRPQLTDPSDEMVLGAAVNGGAERIVTFNVAIAEKAAALRTAAYFRERTARADLPAFDRVLAKAGSEPPRVGDEKPSHQGHHR